MDNAEDDYLTNLSWLNSELQSAAECDNNHIDDDLQCLCWITKMRPSHSVKRLSARHNRSALHPIASTDDNSTSRQILMLRTLSPIKTYQQSFILIRSSNGKLSCLSIRHFV